MSAVPFTRDDYAARMARVVADGEAAGVDGVLVPLPAASAPRRTSRRT